MKTVTILGAAGRIGEACAIEFLNAGWRVRGVARGAKLSTLAKGVEPVEANAMDAEALIAACAGSDVIIHALNPAYDDWEATVLPFGRNVLAAAKASGATVMIPGNVYNFGTSIGLNMGEDMPFAADTHKGKIRVELEQLFDDAAKDGVNTIIIRAGDFFGGKRLFTYFDSLILRDLRKGKFAWPGPYNVPHSFAYLPDYAETFVRVAQIKPALKGFNMLHFEGHTMTGQQAYEAITRVMGKKLKRGYVPWALLRFIGLFNSLLRAIAQMSYLWRVGHSLDGRKLAGLIDVPHTPLDDAMRQMIVDQKLN